MGYRKDWDMNAIKHSLWKMAYECSSPYNDGFTALMVKTEMLQLKFLLDELIAKSPKFEGEEDIYHQYLIDKLK